MREQGVRLVYRAREKKRRKKREKSLIYLFMFRAHCHLRIPDVVQVVKNDVAKWDANERREGRRGEFSSWEGGVIIMICECTYKSTAKR